MAIKDNGEISLLDVNKELGFSENKIISMNDKEVLDLLGITTIRPISFDEFYGKNINKVKFMTLEEFETTPDEEFFNPDNLDKFYIDDQFLKEQIDFAYKINSFSPYLYEKPLVLNTSKVTSMISMFSYCSVLETLDLSDFDTSKVTDMSHMFNRCNSLKTLNLSSFDTSKVTNMNSMFGYCDNLQHLKLSKKWTLRNSDGLKLPYRTIIYTEPDDIDRMKALFPDNTILSWLEWR